MVPLRVVEREKELTEEESISLWLAMRKVNAVIEKQYKASALNLAIQVIQLYDRAAPNPMKF